MQKTVAIFGGGISGLTTAHELCERGYRVKVYERNDILGGKARSFSIKGHLDARNEYPGEHGFRFFIKWYENLHDTLKRIPTDAGSVFDNLVEVKELQVDEFLFSFKETMQAPVRPPISWLKAMISCDKRHEEEFEMLSWDEYIVANYKNDSHKSIRFFQNTPKVTASVHSTEASVRALSYTLNRFLTNNGLDILNAPTNEAFFDHWEKYLRSKGVEFVLNASLSGFEFKDGKIASATIAHGDKKIIDKSDYFVTAIPHHNLESVLTKAQIEELHFQNYYKLKSGWQAGIVFYLEEPVPMPRGHFGFSESPWAISGILQSDFWSNESVKKNITDKKFGACLSLIIADWDAPGLIYKKAAKECTLPELVDELLLQMEINAPETYAKSFAAIKNILIDYSIDPGIHLKGGKQSTNETPLYMNVTDSWEQRPDAETIFENFFVAGDYAKTSAYLATMESANESGRRAANALLKKSGYKGDFCSIFTEKHNKKPKVFGPLIKIDEILYNHNKTHLLDYLDDAQKDRFIDAIIPYISFDGNNLRNVDGLYDSALMLFEILGKQVPELSSEIVEMMVPDKALPEDLLKEDINDRANNWAKINLMLVDHKPKQFPESLNAYIDINNPIFNPMLHVAKNKGSMNRAQFAMALNKWYAVPMDRLTHLMETGQSMHNCSLLIDDIMDNTIVRRQEKTAHEIYGINQTLCAAYTTYFQVLLSTYINLGNKCLMHYIEETTRAHIGQSEDIYYRETKTAPTEDKYMEMVANKTGSFFRVFCMCLSALSNEKNSKKLDQLILEFADVVGKLYQVRDDFMDLVSEEYFAKKGTFASDFEEGKYSFPIIHCIQLNDENAELFRKYLGKENITQEEKQLLFDCLKRSGSLEYTSVKVSNLYNDAIALLSEINLYTHVPNQKMYDWLTQLMADVPYVHIDKEINMLNIIQEAKPKDPFELKTLSRDSLHRAMRNVFCSYHVYFKLYGWTREQFWDCFPLLLTVESMIINVDNENEDVETTASILDWNIIKKSKTWGIISKSSFYSPKMDSILEDAIHYYQLEKRWFLGDKDLNTREYMEKMNHFKSTNFRILHLLSKNICERERELIFTEDMEDYASTMIEEMETAFDEMSQSYNTFHHANRIDSSNVAFVALKERLSSRLNQEQKQMAQNWFEFYKNTFEFKPQSSNETIECGLKRLYASAQEISIVCKSDEDMADFTLQGNFKWCINKFFTNIHVEKSKDQIYRRLQSDALLSMSV